MGHRFYRSLHHRPLTRPESAICTTKDAKNTKFKSQEILISVHHRDTEHAEIEVFFNQELFTLRTRRLRGKSLVQVRERWLSSRNRNKIRTTLACRHQRRGPLSPRLA